MRGGMSTGNHVVEDGLARHPLARPWLERCRRFSWSFWHALAARLAVRALILGLSAVCVFLVRMHTV